MTKVTYGLMGGIAGVCALVLSNVAIADDCCQSAWSPLATVNGGAKTCTITKGGGTCTATIEYAGPTPCGFCRTFGGLTDTTGAYSPAYQFRCRTSSSGSWNYSAWTDQNNIGFVCDGVTTTQEQCRTELADTTFCSGGTCNP